jgi:transcriptional regulator with XRE-family HTH domain
MRKNNFPEWLNLQLRERNMSQTEFAHRSDNSDAQVSRVLSGESLPGIDFLNGTAKALGVSLEFVLTQAGWLSEKDKDSDYVQELTEKARHLLRDEDIQELIYIANMKLQRQIGEENERKNRRAKPNSQTTQPEKP